MCVPGGFCTFSLCSKFSFNPGCCKELHAHFPILPYYSQMSPEKYRLSVNMTFWKSINMYNVLTKCEREGWCTWGIWVWKGLRVFCGAPVISYSLCSWQCAVQRPRRRRFVQLASQCFQNHTEMHTRSLPV